MEPQTLIITNIREQARYTRSFDLKPQGTSGHHGLSFSPGQVAILKVAGEEQGYFAFASAPDDTDLEVLVKQKIGASKIIFDMAPGQAIELTGIAGHGFDLSEQKSRDLVFVAMGTGVAPLRSALRHVLKRKDDYGQLVVLYGARTPDDFCYRERLMPGPRKALNLGGNSRPDGRLVRSTDMFNLCSTTSCQICRHLWR